MFLIGYGSQDKSPMVVDRWICGTTWVHHIQDSGKTKHNTLCTLQVHQHISTCYIPSGDCTYLWTNIEQFSIYGCFTMIYPYDLSILPWFTMILPWFLTWQTVFLIPSDLTMASWTARPGRPVGVDGGAGIAEFQKQGVACPAGALERLRAIGKMLWTQQMMGGLGSDFLRNLMVKKRRFTKYYCGFLFLGVERRLEMCRECGCWTSKKYGVFI